MSYSVCNICVHYFVILPFHTTVFSFQDEVTRKKRKKERETGKQTFHFSASFKSVPTTTLTDLKKWMHLTKMYLWWSFCALYLHACQVCLLYLCYVFRVVINSLVCWFDTYRFADQWDAPTFACIRSQFKTHLLFRNTQTHTHTEK